MEPSVLTSFIAQTCAEEVFAALWLHMAHIEYHDFTI